MVGDCIFRKGIQADSFIVNQITDGEYSHIGMVIVINPEIKIIHVVITHNDDSRPNQAIVSSLAEFIILELAKKYTIAGPNFFN